MFVVDVCLIEEELSALKQSLTQALSLLPENASVGLITYGTHVHVHELGFDECPKSYVFRGSKEFTSQQIQDQLFRSTGGARPRPGQQTNGAAVTGHQSKFLVPLADCEFQLTSVLEELSRDSFSALPDCRPARCTGTAVAVAATLLASSVSNIPARAMLFVGGPATDGGGQVVGKELETAMRSHKDIAKARRCS